MAQCCRVVVDFSPKSATAISFPTFQRLARYSLIWISDESLKLVVSRGKRKEEYH